MLLGIIKKYIADYDEELMKMGKINEVLQHITTDLTYVSRDVLVAENIGYAMYHRCFSQSLRTEMH